ncbi:MAG TPA: NADPH-dependent FMN reductase [Candidatus Saccharimonadales bacterium]|nr:NADPH-dependent FMN reductase [Candidatus Saccharimonadales bacterium]
MEDLLNIVVVAGTTRVKRESIHAAKLVAEVGQGIAGIKIVFVDPVDFKLPGDGNDPEGKDPRYSEITKAADGFFVVTPEYNHSFPGSLKRLLDSELENYSHKPVALAGASSGGWGGVRAVESLVPSVREMGLVVTSFSIYFPRVQNLFDDQGKLQDEKYRASIKKAYDELIWMAKALKQARLAG